MQLYLYANYQMKKLFFAFVFISGFYSGFAQKTLVKRNAVWISYSNTLHIGEHWTYQNEFMERFYIHPVKEHQFQFRTIARYKLAETWDIGLGFMYGSNNTDAEVLTNVRIPEFRPYLEINNNTKLKHVNISNRYRMECRIIHNKTNTELIDGYTTTGRFRYQFKMDVPILKPKEDKNGFKFVAGDEILLNFGKKIVTNLFDGNRLFGGLNYAPVQQFNMEIGYLYWFQQRGSGKYFTQHVIRFAMATNFNLHRKKKEEETKQQ
jgi:hypothetical protein